MGPKDEILRAHLSIYLPIALLTLAACTRAATLAAGLAAIIATASTTASRLQLATLAECHCTENNNERK